MAEQDRKFLLVELGSGATGQEAWSQTAEQVKSAPSPSKPIRLGGQEVAKGVLGYMPELAADLPVLVRLLSEEEYKALAETLEQLPRLCHALFYLEGSNSGDENTLEVLQKRIEEGKDLKRRGMHWLDVLSKIGLVSVKKVKEIRSKQGHQDLANDLQQIGPLLTLHIEKVNDLMVTQKDHTLTLDATQINRMASLGTVIFQDVSHPKSSPNFKRVLNKTIHLISVAWEHVKIDFNFGRDRGRLPHRTQALPPLSTLARKPPAPKKQATKPPKTPKASKTSKLIETKTPEDAKPA